LDSIEPLAQEATQSMTAEQLDTLLSPLAQLAGMNLSNS
jgi:hypothetical protein